MSGLSEILLILLIVVVLFFLPRMVSRSAPPSRRAPRPLLTRLSGRLRLAILASVVWPAAAVLWLQPWLGNQLLFVVLGAAPVIVGWGIYWVVSGFKQYRR